MKTPPYARPVMPMLLALAFAGLGALHAQNPPATPPDDGFRRWTDTSGKAVEAQLVELLPDRHTVRLRLRNGKDLTVKLERLSAADRKWVAEWKPRGGPQAAAVVAEWTVLDDDRSSQDHNAANDLVSIALRQPPGQPEALEILVTFRKGTPDSGAISICLMSLESPSEGVSFQVTLKQPEPQVSVEKLIDGKWKATSDFRTRAERTQDQIRIHVHGWILKAFHYSASLSVRAQQFVEIPMPSDNSGRVIKVDGEVGDWVGAKAAWQSATARLHATHCVADPRVIWANLNGDLLQLRIQFPDRAVLWEKDGDVKCHSGVGIAFNPKGTERMQPKLWCRFPREVKEVSSELGAANQQLTFSLGASEMEIAVKGLPKHDDGMRIGLLFDSLKSDDIAGGVFCAGKTAAENAEETRKLGRRDMWDGGVTLLQHKLLACEMDRATADALEKRLAGDAAAANLAYRKIPALVKQGKIREIARSELGGHSGQRAKAEPQGKKVKLIRSSTGEEYEWPLGLHVELEATADSDPKFEWLNTFIELNEEWQQPGKLFFRRIDCGFAPFPAARPVVFWRWDEGEKSALLIGSYEPVPRPPALVAPASPGLGGRTCRFDHALCPLQVP